jgi:hypothetical protein
MNVEIPRRLFWFLLPLMRQRVSWTAVQEVGMDSADWLYEALIMQ